jgi:hypothetical protein
MIIKKIFIVLLLIASPIVVTVSKAAGMGMGPPLPCGGPFPPCPIPLDNGVLLLLLAGLAYGGKKIYDSLKKNPA